MQRTLPFMLLGISLCACAPGGGSNDAGPVGGPPPNPRAEDLAATWEDLPGAVQALASPVEPGALEGTFALRATSATIVDTQVFGFQTGGGVNYRLLRRTWNADVGSYTQSSELCGGYNYEVAGVVTEAPQTTYRRVPDSTEEEVFVDDETGAFISTGHVQLWGVRDLPDPRTTPLPATKEEAAEEPHASRIYDMDEDDQPGITLLVSGLVEGEVYAAQRKTVDQTGVVTGADGASGFTTTTYSTVILGADNPLVEAADPSGAEPHPDANESWFSEQRVEDGMDCAALMERVAAGEYDPETPPWL
jgi:hypothetical protein